jgi:heme-degrading monooxygenase HmoA
MTVGLVALQYPRPEHWDEMICRVRQAAEVMAAAPGCLAVNCWMGGDHQAVVTTGQWESEQALRAGFAAVQAAGIDFDYDQRESRPRQVFTLVPA